MGAPSQSATATAHKSEVASGSRFEFGRNWRRFLAVVDEERIGEAERSLREMLGVESLRGLRFLDIGSGSGLFSLAAARLGAEEIRSFDFDPQSVACTRELRARHFDDPERWTIEEGSVLDADFIESLGHWDIVYSWGVLHHTGAMWRALDLAQSRAGERGRVFVSIYNDAGRSSRRWRVVKRVYNRLPAALQPLFVIAAMGPREVVSLGIVTLRGRPMEYVRSWTEYKRRRGMSRWHDHVDWMGGYPYEVARPEEVVDFMRERGFDVERVTLGRKLACNEYVFRRLEP